MASSLMSRSLVVGAVLGLFACRNTTERRLPQPIDDAGTSILQHGDPEIRRKPVRVLEAFEKLDWSVGLSRPLDLLEYKPNPAHPPFCREGGALLDELRARIEGDAASPCSVRRSAEAQELELQCRIEIEGECLYLYRATLWTEVDRAIEHEYRLLGTAWLQETVCKGPDKGKRAGADPDFTFHVRIGKSFRSLIDQCRQPGTQSP